jgi:4-hydroxybenzoate polyprenyltransferase
MIPNCIIYCLDLIRIRQWYKNLVVFLALFFSANLFNFVYVKETIIAFFALCFISSFGYIINDIIDIKKDQSHPEKLNRPLAAGKIIQSEAIIVALTMASLGILLALQLNTITLIFIILICIVNLCYSFILKHIMLADILTISTLFVLRAIIGAVAISVTISPWLILCPFFLSLFLSIGKRHGDLLLLKEKAFATRKVLQEYTPTFTFSLMNISTSLLVTSYALYSFLSPYNHLFYTLPFALFVIFRYYHLLQSGSIITRHPEQIIKDLPLCAGLVVWTFVTFILIYIRFA